MTITRGPVLPGATIGVLGSGQLGRMFAIAARRMGYRVHTLSPDNDTPTGQVADREFAADYADLDAVREFAQSVDVMTFEFENVPSRTAQFVAELVPVRPDGSVLHITQHRAREKCFLAQHGFPVTNFRLIHDVAELRHAVAEIGLPAILKTAGFGYDGKGQVRIDTVEDVETAYAEVGAGECVLEAVVEFEREFSVVAARGRDGDFAHWGCIDNDHSQRILDVSVSPSSVSQKIADEAVDVARGIVEQLDMVGVLCVEFFLTTDGRLLVNELAPRPHNSGHLTFDASVTSQFEQQLRAVCDLPLGSTRMLCPAAMANLLGDLWNDGPPNWRAAAELKDVKIHLYGKLAPRPGRKMGHLTSLADTPERARQIVVEARNRLRSA